MTACSKVGINGFFVLFEKAPSLIRSHSVDLRELKDRM